MSELSVSVDGEEIHHEATPSTGSSEVRGGLQFKLAVAGTYCSLGLDISFKVACEPGQEPATLERTLEQLEGVLVRQQARINRLRTAAGLPGSINFGAEVPAAAPVELPAPADGTRSGLFPQGLLPPVAAEPAPSGPAPAPFIPKVGTAQWRIGS